MHEDTELEEVKGVFNYVNEREYAKIVQERQEEGFIINDGEEWRRGWSEVEEAMWEEW